ncbi:MAG: formylglycine-generating enzyme family protein [Pyrinomonadaceae bacterium]
MKAHAKLFRLVLVTSALACALALPPPRRSSARQADGHGLPVVGDKDWPRPWTVVRVRSGIELVYVPPGRFMMGSNERPDEKPVHRVTVRRGFYMGRHEVTQAQWRDLMGTTVRQQRDRGNPSWNMAGEGDNHPMYYVSWHEAQEFIRRLNFQNDGFVYRLPSEAEWEYACRAGSTDSYASQPGPLIVLAWWNDNSGRQSHPVGQKSPNLFGLYDMHGNVWEWCEDYYHESYLGAPANGSARRRAGATGYRVMRGGSWDHDSVHARSANRDSLHPQTRGNHVGLRVVAAVRK